MTLLRSRSVPPRPKVFRGGATGTLWGSITKFFAAGFGAFCPVLYLVKTYSKKSIKFNSTN